jgi:DNA-binding HxlR family transcriptional regulator
MSLARRSHELGATICHLCITDFPRRSLYNLERDGFLSREVFPEVPPRVEYELTGQGLSLLEPMQQLVQWIGGNWNSIKKARESFDKRAR